MPFDFRFASVADIDDLLALEQRCFALDRLRRRHFHWMISRANAGLIVATCEGTIAGYALLLFRRNTAIARLYSLAVSPDWRGHGLGQQLLEQAQACAADRNRSLLRLEVRADNPAAVRLYEASGYYRFSIAENFYEDHAPALRYEKRIGGQSRVRPNIP